MRLGAPAALWLLGILPAIVLLYMLRARRQEVLISSVLLWQRARRDLAVQLPLRRLERNLLLLLQLLAAALAILALARPQVALPTAVGAPTVIVMDTSAGMQATDISPSRFEAARAQVLALLAEGGGPVMVVEAGPQPRIAAPFGARAAARSVLAQLRPTDAPANVERAVALATAQRFGSSDVSQRVSAGSASIRPHVVVFTDRAGLPLPGVEYRVIGQSSRNIAIVGLSAERRPDGTRVVIQVRNAGTSPERVPVRVSLGSRRLLERALTLPAGSTTSVVVPATGQGVLKAELVTRDALAVDNAAYAVVGAPPPRVLVIGQQDRILNEALAALSIQFSPGERPTDAALAAADVIVLNGTPPVDLPPGNYLLLGTTAPNLPAVVDGVVRTPQIVRWSPTHPVMRYVDLTGVGIGQTLALRPKGGHVLAEGEVPLIWAYEGEAIRAIVVGFPLQQSDLALKVAFPIFLNNAVAWLGGSDQPYLAGQPLLLPAQGERQAVLSDPSGTSTVLRASGGRFVVPSLERVGVYTLRVGNRERLLAVNPAPESADITPIFPIQTAGGTDETAPRGERLYGLWPILLAFALAVLLVEWVIWLRNLPRAGFGRGATGPSGHVVMRR